MDICAVIVIYGKKYSETQTYQSLLCVSRNMPHIRMHIIIYDNSKEKNEVLQDDIFENLVYFHDPQNLGVVPGYIYAQNYCQTNNIDWLLRLDQDSSFGLELLEEFFQIIMQNNVKAVVPRIYCNENIVSPSIIRKGGIIRPISVEAVGCQNFSFTFINSMSFVKVGDSIVRNAQNSLSHLLDLSDHEFSVKLPVGSVYIMQTKVEHFLSVSESGYVSSERYKNIILNEFIYISAHETRTGMLIYKARLVLRVLRFIANFKVTFVWITLKYVLKRKVC